MYWKELISYLISFIIGIIIIVYLLDVGSIITGNKAIVKTYYYYLPNLLLDLFFVWIYLMVALGIIRFFKIEQEVYKFIIVVAATLVITSLWCLYFRSKQLTTSFFSKWFNTVGYSSAVYDAILVGFIYLIYVRIMEFMSNF
jgi:hypothetical protein